MLTTMLTTCLFALLAAEATALKFTWFQTEGTLELDLKVQCSGPVELKMQCTAPSLIAIVSRGPNLRAHTLAHVVPEGRVG